MLQVFGGDLLLHFQQLEVFAVHHELGQVHGGVEVTHLLELHVLYGVEGLLAVVVVILPHVAVESALSLLLLHRVRLY